MTNARHTHTQAGAGRGSGQRYILSGNSNNGDRWGRLYARSHFSFSLPAHNSTRPCKRTDMSWELNRRRINVRWPVIILSVGKLYIANQISKNPDLLLLLLLQSYTIREKKNTKLMSLFLSSLTIVCSQLDQITHHRRIIINLTSNVKDENNIWVGSVIFFCSAQPDARLQSMMDDLHLFERANINENVIVANKIMHAPFRRRLWCFAFSIMSFSSLLHPEGGIVQLHRVIISFVSYSSN